MVETDSGNRSQRQGSLREGVLEEADDEPTASGVTILGVSKRGFAESSRIVFRDLPGALFTSGDRAFTFPSKSYALASASAAGGLYSFHVETLVTIDSR